MTNANDRGNIVRDLNNRGCATTLARKYSEANELFESALKIHKQMIESKVSPQQCSCDCDCHKPRVQDVDNTSCTPFRCHDDSCNEEDIEDSDDESDTELAFVPWFPSISSRIRRMTTTSNLRRSPFCGQHEFSSEDKLHQVYSLPIVMDAEEWDVAWEEDRSFVLLFNAALCNHIMGIELLGDQQLQSQEKNCERQLQQQLCHKSFSVARLLYRLGLENVVTTLKGVERICYLAIFNNLSHVCKTLEGYESQEAYLYDRLLVRSIYWYKDTETADGVATTQTSSEINGTYSPGQSSSTNLQANAIRSNYSYEQGIMVNESLGPYNETDSDIIDAFMGNVFYLIAAPEQTAPASAA